MEMKGEQRIAAPRTKVWEALNDPNVLRQCIPGCQTLDKVGDDRLEAVVEIKIGPIGARFKGAVTISDAKPPESYKISGEGQGGTVGNAKGGAKVHLTEVDGGTLLAYEVEAQVGGRLAQLGGPIIDATAKQLAGKFFTKFGEVVEGPAAAPAATAPVASAAPAAPGAAPAAAPIAAPQYVAVPAPLQPVGTPWIWIVATALALISGFLIGRSDAGEVWMIVGLLALLVTGVAGFQAGKRSGGR
ncbi:CoxG family protein [Novosphingobium sp. JCM 18896]|uniref:CoxG family protein n=1 Tax=Novosphingobium sp. JCM 18896 TaxID=2989731 RepID=UPI00222367F8|nr:carbon monoxide dehydrogenase subunit G [Novosphingobium sp. JCM 18896]